MAKSKKIYKYPHGGTHDKKYNPMRQSVYDYLYASGRDTTAVNTVLDLIGEHESFKDYSSSQEGGGPGRGAYQFELGPDKGARTASKRLFNLLDNYIGERPADKTFYTVGARENVNASYMQPGTQDALFIADKLFSPEGSTQTKDFNNLLKSPTSENTFEFWAKHHKKRFNYGDKTYSWDTLPENLKEQEKAKWQNRTKTNFNYGGKVMKYKYGGHYGVPNYGDGGLFKSIFGKKFKDSGFGKGLRDMGVATLNTAASPFESLMGTDFGIDEKFGYKTKFGETYGGVGETAGSILGQLAPTALNMVAPGTGTALSLVGQSFGSGLEGAGITQDISTDPQSAMGSQIGGMMNMMAMMNPSGGAGQFTQNMSNTGFMQQLAAMLSGQNGSMKHGGMNYKYGQGGMAQQADVEVESGEVVQTEGGTPRSYNPKAPLKSIGANGFKVQGKESHAKGGVAMTMPNGENRVYAKKNAAEAEKLLKLIAQAQKDVQSSDFITRTTAELDVKKYTRQLDDRFEQQQKENGNQTNMTTDMAKNGLWANIHAKRKRIAAGSGERMRKPGSKGAPTNEAIKNSQAKYGMQYMKAQDGMGLSINNPAFGNVNNFGLPGFSSTPGANTFNSMYGNGVNPALMNQGASTGGGLQVNTPSQYEQVPFQSQYSGLQGVMPYAGSIANLAIGLKGLKDPGSFDASKYMVQPELKNTRLNKAAMLAPDMQAYTTAINSVNDPRYKTMMHANFMPQLAKRSEGIEFLQSKLEGENVDTINKFKGLNARTQYGIDMKNAELAALPYQFINQAFTDAGATSQQMGENKRMEQMLYNMFPEYRKV